MIKKTILWRPAKPVAYTRPVAKLSANNTQIQRLNLDPQTFQERKC